MSSYQPVSVGIPASQNPYPSIPYSQNFPNEPDSEASHLKAPLNNNPQNHYPPQQHYPPHHFYGQQPVAMGQPDPFYGAPQGYGQPPEYMVVPVDPERRQLWTKIKDIEERLGNGWYFAYIVWLWIGIVGSVLGVFQLAMSFLVLLVISNFERDIGRGYQESGFINFLGFIFFLVQISWYVWSFQQCLVLKNAMNDKNLQAARRGLKSMIWFAVYYFVTFIAHTVFFYSILPENMKEKGVLSFVLQIYLVCFAIGTYVHLYGAKKVIELLSERETLALDFNTRYGTNLA